MIFVSSLYRANVVVNRIRRISVRQPALEIRAPRLLAYVCASKADWGSAG